MAKVAEDTLTKSGSTVRAVVNTRENVETVAQAASELSRTIDELALRTSDVFKLTNDTAEQSESASAELAMPLRWNRFCRSPILSKASRSRQSIGPERNH